MRLLHLWEVLLALPLYTLIFIMINRIGKLIKKYNMNFKENKFLSVILFYLENFLAWLIFWAFWQKIKVFF